MMPMAMSMFFMALMMPMPMFFMTSSPMPCSYIFAPLVVVVVVNSLLVVPANTITILRRPPAVA